MNRRLLFVFIFCFFSLLAVMRGGQLLSKLRQNWANTLIHNSFSQEQTDANSRQRAMTASAAFLATDSPGSSAEPTTSHESAMIPAALHGLFYHRLGDLEKAAFWYNVAAQAEPKPDLQRQILISPWMELTASGDFVLAGNSTGWHKRADTNPGSKLIVTEDKKLLYLCSEIPADNRRAALEWKEGFDIPYHHSLVLRAKANPGTILILETVIDGQLTRHLTHNGTGMWQDFTIQVEGDHVKYIYLLVREDTNAAAKSCQVELDSITFLLDETVDDDHTR